MLSGVGVYITGMPGYAIRPAAEWMLVRHQPLPLKLCIILMEVIACAEAGDGDV